MVSHFRRFARKIIFVVKNWNLYHWNNLTKTFRKNTQKACLWVYARLYWKMKEINFLNENPNTTFLIHQHHKKAWYSYYSVKIMQNYALTSDIASVQLYENKPCFLRFDGVPFVIIWTVSHKVFRMSICNIRLLWLRNDFLHHITTEFTLAHG